MVDVEVTLNKKLIINAQNTILRDSLPFNFRNDLTRNHHINATQGHLILSSSAGSVVALSSSLYASGSSHSITGTLRVNPNLDLPNANAAYHIRAVNSNLILSSSAGSVVVLSSSLYASGSSHVMTGTLRVDPNLDLSNAGSSYHVRAVNSYLILSSSAGSVVALSSSLYASGSSHSITGTFRIDPNIDLSNAGSSYHVRAVNSNLILSSSVDSVVAISGVLGIRGLQNDIGINIINDVSRNLKIRDALGNIILTLSSSAASARARVGIATTTPDHFAALDIGGTAGALIVPRLTNAQKDALTGVAGMVIYSTTSGSFLFYNTSWKIVTIV